jgi:Na+-transporting methylmalonyl-CoA/oxaloacetate decarboxylase gamma subunit
MSDPLDYRHFFAYGTPEDCLADITVNQYMYFVGIAIIFCVLFIVETAVSYIDRAKKRRTAVASAMETAMNDTFPLREDRDDETDDHAAQDRKTITVYDAANIHSVVGQ